MVAVPLSVFGTQSVTLAWNPVTNANVTGYNVYYGSASGNYTNVTSVGNVTNATISGLTEGATYYFAATALNTLGLESTYSTEVSYTVPATPVLQVTPGSIGYGTMLVGTSKTNNFTVQNIGTGTLSGSASVSAPFSVVSGGSYNLGAGQTQLVMVSFSPVVASNYNQSVSFTGGVGTNTTVSGSATNAPVPVPIIQVTPGSIGYGTMLVGTSKTNNFTVQNIGTGTLSGSASVSAPFSVVSGGSYNLGAGQTQLVMVSFSPVVASNYNQSVSFTGGVGTNTTVSGSATNAPVPVPIIQVTPGSIGYGTMLVGTSKTNNFTVQNIGTGTLSGSASVSAPFSVVSGGSYNLGAGQTQLVMVSFSPVVASNYNQSVSFTGGVGTNTTVSGSATNAPVPVPIIQVTPGSIGYGTMLVGTSKTNNFTVQNIGTGTLSGSASVSAPFSVVSGGSYNLGAGQTQLVMVSFSPVVASNYNQSVSFTGGVGTNTTVSGSATNAPVPVPIIQVTPGSIGYGTMLVGTSKTNNFTVQNIGTGTLSGSASVSAPFSVVSGGSYNLGAGQTQLVVVSFSPVVASNYNQSVSFTGGVGTNTTVSGSATNAPPPVTPTISAISVSAPDVDPTLPGLQIYSGTTVQFAATATNAHTWQWSYSINGGAPVVYTNSTSPITNISYYFDTNAVGNSYVWTLVVSNGQAWAESQTNLSVEVLPNSDGSATNGGLTFEAAAVPSSGLLTASTIINGVQVSYIYQPLPSIGNTSGGTAVYNFTVTNAGNYEIQALVNAPNLNANSFYVNIDSQPQDSTMIWDIMPITSGFEQRTVSWRGTGSENNDQIDPKTFNLAAGPHQIIFVGREPGTALASFTLIPVASVTGNTSPSPVTVNSINHNVRSVADSTPLITNASTNYVAVAGQTVTLNVGVVNVSSASTLAYQWRFNSDNLSMANDATLTLKSVTTNQSGTYTLAVSNQSGISVSSPIILTVYPTAAGTLAAAPHPAGQFNVSVSGVPGYHYEVQVSTNLVDWVSLQTNTAPFLFIDSDAGKFKQRFYRTLYVQ